MAKIFKILKNVSSTSTSFNELMLFIGIMV